MAYINIYSHADEYSESNLYRGSLYIDRAYSSNNDDNTIYLPRSRKEREEIARQFERMAELIRHAPGGADEKY